MSLIPPVAPHLHQGEATASDLCQVRQSCHAREASLSAASPGGRRARRAQSPASPAQHPAWAESSPPGACSSQEPSRPRAWLRWAAVWHRCRSPRSAARTRTRSARKRQRPARCTAARTTVAAPGPAGALRPSRPARGAPPALWRHPGPHRCDPAGRLGAPRHPAPAAHSRSPANLRAPPRTGGRQPGGPASPVPAPRQEHAPESLCDDPGRCRKS